MGASLHRCDVLDWGGEGGGKKDWKDIWCDEETLNTFYLAMFEMAIQKDAMVVDVWDNISEVGGWSPCS